MFPVTVNYLSPFESKQTYNFRVAEDESIAPMTPLFLWASLMSVMQSARMGQSDYHTFLKGEISLKGHENIEFDNFYGGGDSQETDIIQSSLPVVLTTAALLMNEFEVPDIEKIELTFDSKPEKKSRKSIGFGTIAHYSNPATQ